MRCEDCVHEKVCEGYSNCEEAGLYEPKRPHGEWILCSDRLPDKDGNYIVSHLFCGEPEVGKSWFDIKRGFTFGMVYAWMPFPDFCKYNKDQILFKRQQNL